MAVVGDKERNKVLDAIKSLVAGSNDGVWRGRMKEIGTKCGLGPGTVRGAIYDLIEGRAIGRYEYDDGRLAIWLVKN